MFDKRMKPAHEDQRQSFFDKCFKDREGKLALAAFPNTPLLAWIVARVLQWPLSGKLESLAQVVAFGALFTWAWLELFDGVNYFRRMLGLVVLLLTIASVMHNFAA